MTKDSIKLSAKHGVNPSIEQCFVCMEDVGVVLFGRLENDAEAPRKVCLGPNSEPCEKCKGHMATGVILISADLAKTTDEQNPWRSGGWIVVRDSFVERFVANEEARIEILKQRVAFVPDEVWDMVGFPKGGPAPDNEATP